MDLLGQLIDQAPTVPLLIVLTFRPEFTPPWPARSHVKPLTLGRLERPQIEVMATRLAGGKALSAEVVEHIVQKGRDHPGHLRRPLAFNSPRRSRAPQPSQSASLFRRATVSTTAAPRHCRLAQPCDL